jgi:general stress protein CsbA
MQQNIYKLSRETIAFLRIFQIFGFLPIKLHQNEINFSQYAFYVLLAVLIAMSILRWYLFNSEAVLAILFLWDIVALIVGQLCIFSTRKRQRDLFQSIGQIDHRINVKLNMKIELRKRNVTLHKWLIFIWVFYILLTLYYPLKKAIQNDISTILFDSLFRMISW